MKGRGREEEGEERRIGGGRGRRDQGARIRGGRGEGKGRGGEGKGRGGGGKGGGGQRRCIRKTPSLHEYHTYVRASLDLFFLCFSFLSLPPFLGCRGKGEGKKIGKRVGFVRRSMEDAAALSLFLTAINLARKTWRLGREERN